MTRGSATVRHPGARSSVRAAHADFGGDERHKSGGDVELTRIRRFERCCQTCAGADVCDARRNASPALARWPARRASPSQSRPPRSPPLIDRKSVVRGKRGSERVDLGGRRTFNKKPHNTITTINKLNLRTT